MEYPIGELCDRYSISCLKTERIGEQSCKDEMDCLGKELLDVYTKFPEVRQYIHELKTMNGQIWDLEADIRAGKDDELGLEEIGRRAILIREKNKIRVGIKNKITEITGSGFKDIKINHISV